MRVLTVNAGSTSLKLSVIEDGRAVAEPADLDSALAADAPDCVAHRVVHGGDRTAAELIDDAVFEQLKALSELAPLHQPPALKAIASCRQRWPEVPHVACFDTAFHTTIPEAARTYAIPARYRETVRVYGFHGLSYAWATSRMRALAPEARRVLLAHLGGGASLCATLDGRSVFTTMGFTPFDGLVMATRSGALDPGAVLWLRDRYGDETGRVLDEESGLQALCGTSDMREVHRRVASGDADAELAFAVWTHRAVTLCGAGVAAIGGLDAVVFTGGIGEHDAAARAAIAQGCEWLGVVIEDRDDRSDGGDREVSAPGSRVRTFVVTAREDLQLAAEAEALTTNRSL